MTDKRARGRPQGSGKKDALHLAKIADIMVARDLKKPTTAMRAYLVQARAIKNFTETDNTLVRRWQVKWKVCGGDLLKSAREKRTAESRKATGTGARNFIHEMVALKSQFSEPWYLNKVSEFHKMTNAANEFHKMLQPASPYLDAIRKMIEVPGLRPQSSLLQMLNSFK